MATEVCVGRQSNEVGESDPFPIDARQIPTATDPRKLVELGADLWGCEPEVAKRLKEILPPYKDLDYLRELWRMSAPGLLSEKVIEEQMVVVLPDKLPTITDPDELAEISRSTSGPAAAAYQLISKRMGELLSAGLSELVDVVELKRRSQYLDLAPDAVKTLLKDRRGAIFNRFTTSQLIDLEKSCRDVKWILDGLDERMAHLLAARDFLDLLNLLESCGPSDWAVKAIMGRMKRLIEALDPKEASLKGWPGWFLKLLGNPEQLKQIPQKLRVSLLGKFQPFVEELTVS